LGHGGIRFVRPNRAYPFILVVDVGGGIEDFLQTTGAKEGRGTPQAIQLAYWLWNLNVTLNANILPDKLEYRYHTQELRGHWAPSLGMENRLHRDRHVGVDVVPKLGQAIFCEDEFRGAHRLPLSLSSRSVLFAERIRVSQQQLPI
jgi:hypothetical protein